MFFNKLFAFVIYDKLECSCFTAENSWNVSTKMRFMQIWWADLSVSLGFMLFWIKFHAHTHKHSHTLKHTETHYPALFHARISFKQQILILQCAFHFNAL